MNNIIIEKINKDYLDRERINNHLFKRDDSQPVDIIKEVSKTYFCNYYKPDGIKVSFKHEFEPMVDN